MCYQPEMIRQSRIKAVVGITTLFIVVGILTISFQVMWMPMLPGLPKWVYWVPLITMFSIYLVAQRVSGLRSHSVEHRKRRSAAATVISEMEWKTLTSFEESFDRPEIGRPFWDLDLRRILRTVIRKR
jgi:hypothetical protein